MEICSEGLFRKPSQNPGGPEWSGSHLALLLPLPTPREVAGGWPLQRGVLHLLQQQRPFSKQATTGHSEKNGRPLWGHSSHAQPSVPRAVVLSGMEVEGLVNPEADGWQNKGEKNIMAPLKAEKGSNPLQTEGTYLLKMMLSQGAGQNPSLGKKKKKKKKTFRGCCQPVA